MKVYGRDRHWHRQEVRPLLSRPLVDTPSMAALFEPITVGDLVLRNRVAMTTHGPRLSQRRYLRYLHERSQDVALVGVSASLGVSGFPFGPVGPGSLEDLSPGEFDAVPPHPLTADGMAYYDSQIAAVAEQAAVIHANGAVAMGQLVHTGVSQHEETTQPVIAPSDVPDEARRHCPHVLTETEIADLITAFGHGARRIVQAGFDAVELHGAHGYLIQQFLSPLTNKRTDEYGGSIGNRMRFLTEIIGAVHQQTDASVPIFVRITGTELAEGGLATEDMAEVARHLQDLGVALINVSGGNYTGLRQGVGLAYVAPAYAGEGVNLAAARQIRQSVDVPVMVAGRFTDLRRAAEAIADQSTDMIGLTRALIADPRIVAKARRGDFDDITPCVGGNECHYGRQVACAVNPAAGREQALEIAPSATSRRVLIVGGGPAGMECARVAAQRGHQVTLVDENEALGGTLTLIARDPNRAEFARYVAATTKALNGLGVVVETDHRLDADETVARRPDIVVIATGARDTRPSVPGVDAVNVLTAMDILRGRQDLGRRVVVIGGLDDHLPTLTISDFLAQQGRAVTLLTETDGVGVGIELASRFLLIRRLLERGAVIERLTGLVAIGPDHIQVRNTFTNEQRRISGVDTVVLSCGRRSQSELAEHLKDKVPVVHVIGDSLAPRRMVNATLDGARVAVTI